MTALAEALLDVVVADLTDVVADSTDDVEDLRLRLCSRSNLSIAF